MPLRNLLPPAVLTLAFLLPSPARGQDRLVRDAHKEPVFAAAFSPDGKLLATAGRDGLVKLWDPATGKERLTFKGHTSYVNCVAFSPDGKVVASGQGQRFVPGEVKLWDPTTGKELASLEAKKGGGAHADAVTAVAFSPDGKTLATAGTDGLVRLWDAEGKKLLGGLRPPVGGEVRALAFFPDGKTLAAGYEADTAGVILWEVATREEKAGPREKGKDQGLALALAADGKALAWGTGQVEVWDLEKNKVRFRLPVKVSSVAFSPDGKLLATVGKSFIRLWDAATGDELAALQPTKVRLELGTLLGSSASKLAFSPDGKTLAGAGKDLELWEVRTLPRPTVLEAKQHRSSAMAFSADGKALASCGEATAGPMPRGEVRVWDPATGKEAATLRGYPGAVRCLAVSPDGKIIAGAGGDRHEPKAGRQVKLWDAAAHKELEALSGHEQGVLTLAFSPDGKVLASASLDGAVKLWEAPGGKLLATLEGHAGPVAALAFSPDGNSLVSAGTRKKADGDERSEVRVWNVTTRKESVKFGKGLGEIGWAGFSPDGKTLALGNRRERLLYLCDPATGKVRDTLESSDVTGFASRSDATSFAFDGRTAAMGDEGGYVFLWDVAGGAKRFCPRVAGKEKDLVRDFVPVEGLALSPDGKRLATPDYVAERQTVLIKLWDVTPVPGLKGR